MAAFPPLRPGAIGATPAFAALVRERAADALGRVPTAVAAPARGPLPAIKPAWPGLVVAKPAAASRPFGSVPVSALRPSIAVAAATAPWEIAATTLWEIAATTIESALILRSAWTLRAWPTLVATLTTGSWTALIATLAIRVLPALITALAIAARPTVVVPIPVLAQVTSLSTATRGARSAVTISAVLAVPPITGNAVAVRAERAGPDT